MRTRRPSRGFTLVELLVVIAILGILVALLVPVVWGAVRTANDARVSAEINSMAQALASFRGKYGDFPPSRIVLSEDGGWDAGSTPAVLAARQWYGTANTTGERMPYDGLYPDIGGRSVVAPTADLRYIDLANRSVSVMRKFFPRVNFTTGAASLAYDFNGNGTVDSLPIYLEGHECLVFFLGGIPIHDGTRIVGMSGFSNSPTNPFVPETATANQNRIAPFYDFRADRLFDDDQDGIPGYIDSLGTNDQARYLAYYSSYGGSGYDPNDVNLDPAALTETGLGGRPFLLSFPVYDPNTLTATRTPISQLPNPYSSSPAVPTTGAATTFINSESYQIISPGRDRQYGVGGQYLTDTDGTRLPGDGQVPETARVNESDNLTSFSNGRLE